MTELRRDLSLLGQSARKVLGKQVAQLQRLMLVWGPELVVSAVTLVVEIRAEGVETRVRVLAVMLGTVVPGMEAVEAAREKKPVG
jgi:hypothetical protein